MASSVVVPNIARKKMIEARAGLRTLPAITGFAFGNGGIDAEGSTMVPTADLTALNSEIARKAYTNLTVVSDLLIRYECDVDEDEFGGEKVSEMALYDSEGDLVSIQFFQPNADDVARTYVIDDDYT